MTAYVQDEDRCQACGARADRSPLAGGCDCAEPISVARPERFPAEIEMENGPNIIVHSREELDFLIWAARNNSRLAEQGRTL